MNRKKAGVIVIHPDGKVEERKYNGDLNEIYEAIHAGLFDIVHVGNGILEITHVIIVERPAQEKCLVMRLLLQSGRSLGD